MRKKCNIKSDRTDQYVQKYTNKAETEKIAKNLPVGNHIYIYIYIYGSEAPRGPPFL